MMHREIYWTPPSIPCSCGATRDYPISIGLPPVGVEARCLKCLRLWTLESYHFTDEGGTQWCWVSEDQPTETVVDAKTLETLARHALGIEAALSGLGRARHPRGAA